MLGRINTVTIAVQDLARVVGAYERALGYCVVERRRVGADEAELWGAQRCAGRSLALLAPAGRGDSWLRFVESERAPGYRPFRHLGWNAAEHIVQDVDALGASVPGADFELIGPPADLSFSDKIRAMQVRGPADEVLYLTQIKEKLPIFDTPDAEVPVDRVFIVILGGRPSLDEVQDWYHARLGVPRAPAIPARISVVANAWGHPVDTRYPIAALPLRGQCYVEADEMPAGVEPRAALAGELPPAIAMVGFDVERLPDDVDWVAPPRALHATPYAGRGGGVCRGPAGELVELVERG